MSDQLQFALDPVAALEAQINHLLFGRVDVPLSADERELLLILRWHKGAANAKPLAEICEKLQLGERRVKQVVRELAVTRRLKIGGSRQAPHGYFLCVTPEDIAYALQPLKNEIRALAERARIIADDQVVLEMLGQLREEFGEERKAG